MSFEPVTLFTTLETNGFGGVPSFIAHLAAALEHGGYAVSIVRITKRDHRGVKEFTHGRRVSYMSLESCVALARSTPSLMCTVTSGKGQGDGASLGAIQLCAETGTPMVIHDTGNFYPEVIEAASAGALRVLVIRKRVAACLERLGVASVVVPHPYVATRTDRGADGRTMRAVCATRVAGRKHTEIIADANQRLLTKDMAVHLWGAAHRPFVARVLDVTYPGWEQFYHGKFPPSMGGAMEFYRRAQLAVDLTIITGDGGGTQYSFLEAVEAGTPLVLHERWVGDSEDEMKSGVNCIAVGDAHALVKVLENGRQYRELADAALQLLDDHSPEAVLPHYRKALSI